MCYQLRLRDVGALKPEGQSDIDHQLPKELSFKEHGLARQQSWSPGHTFTVGTQGLERLEGERAAAVLKDGRELASAGPARNQATGPCKAVVSGPTQAFWAQAAAVRCLLCMGLTPGDLQRVAGTEAQKE